MHYDDGYGDDDERDTEYDDMPEGELPDLIGDRLRALGAEAKGLVEAINAKGWENATPDEVRRLRRLQCQLISELDQAKAFHRDMRRGLRTVAKADRKARGDAGWSGPAFEMDDDGSIHLR